jgi:hypothetical protein
MHVTPHMLLLVVEIRNKPRSPQKTAPVQLSKILEPPSKMVIPAELDTLLHVPHAFLLLSISLI